MTDSVISAVQSALQASGTTTVRYGGPIAPGVTVLFEYDLVTGRLACEHHGTVPRNAAALASYRAYRFEFMRRVAAAIGGRVAMVELDAHGQPDELLVVDAPAAGHA